MDDDELYEVEYEEYPLEIRDPYWKKHYESLRKAGIPEYIAKPAIIKTEREASAKVAYQ